MNDAAPAPGRSDAPDSSPTACPFCQSTSIITTAKKADDDSYWRCTTCGEIWNVARNVTGSRGGPRWR